MPSTSTAPGGRVVEAADQLHDGRLAGAGLAHQRHGLARGDGQVDAVEGLVADGVGVAEVHVVEADLARRGARGRPGASGGGVPLGVASSSSILAVEAAACCQVSSTWDSCWIGEKNWSR